MSAPLTVRDNVRPSQPAPAAPLPHRRRGGRLVLSLALVVLASGCGSISNWYHNGFKVGPNYGRPAAPVADAWLDAYDQRVRSELPDNPQWWLVFDDPQLNELVQTMYDQNLTLRAAGMRVLQARAMRGVAVGGLFPQLQEGFGSYNRQQLSTTTAGIGKLIGEGLPINRQYDTWTAGFDAYWELDIWGKFRRNIEAADAELDASIEDYDAILVSLLAETAATYVEYRTAQEALDYARANVQTQEGSLKIAQDKFEGGVYSELDAKQALTNLKTTEQLVPATEARVRDANLRLCTLMGIPPRDLAPELGNGPIPVPSPDVALGVPADLLRRRPDVRAAERRVAAQSARIGVATADLFPHFGITGSIRVDAERFKDLFSQASSAGIINPGFAWDVLNYGRLISTVRAQDARFQELAYQYQQLVLSANAEVESAINNFLNAQERLKAAEEAVAASKRSVEIIELQSEKGAVDMNRVFTLQRALVQDQERLAATRGEVALYLIAAYKAIGGGWEIRSGGGALAATVPPAAEPAAAPLEAEPAEAAPLPTDTVPAPADTM